MPNARGEAWKSTASTLVLLAVNAYLAARLFRFEYLDAMWSVEGAYIGLARYIQHHFHDLNWFPLWYGGIPFPDTYPPLLHFLVAGGSAAARISTARAYHIVVAIFYAAGPVALFWLARRLSLSRAAAFLSAFCYSVLSPSVLFIGDIRRETGDWMEPRRLAVLTRYGDGPHLAGLVLATFAIGMLHLALRRLKPGYSFLAALALAAVVLTNWIAAFFLALAVICELLSRLGDGKRSWRRAAGIGCLAYAMAMPWTTPSNIRIIMRNAPTLVGFHGSGAQRAAVVALAATMVVLAWAFMRRGVESSLRFAVLLLYGIAAINLLHFWAGLDLLPQPHRYHLELDLALWLMAGFAFDRSANKLARFPKLRLATAVAVLLLCLGVVVHQHRVARAYVPSLDIRTTAQYKVARWLSANLPGARVFVPASFDSWMDAFSDTPMITGGFANGIVNQILWGVNYQIYFGDKPEVTLAWLKALGCDAIIAAGADVPGYFPYGHPEKLRGFRELWRDGSVVIYQVPRLRRSLAHAIRPSDLPTQEPPSYDPRPMTQYLAALDDPALPPADFRWKGVSAATITADLRPDNLLSVQVSWDEGWEARVGGRPRRLWADQLGQIVVEPLCDGVCTVDLVYDGGWQMWLARIAATAAFGGGIVWALAMRRRANPAHL